MRRRLVGLATATATLAAGGSWAAVTVAGHGTAARQQAAAGSDRFLELTSDTPATGPATAARTVDAKDAESNGAATRTPGCAADPSTLGQMPNGWCIRPAGRNVEVLRFPLGVLPVDGGSKVVVTSGGGGVQGLTQVDASTLS